MRLSFLLLARSTSSRGASLIELGLVMVFMSLALVPIVQMVGGPQSSSGEGNAARITAMKSKEAILANTMVEKVLSNDFSSFDCDTSGMPKTFTPLTDLPVGTNAANSYRQFGMCRSQASNNELYYQWSVVHLNSYNNNNDTPQQNRYYQATFNVLGSDRQTVLLTMPTNFFYNEGAFNQPSTSTGVVFAMDASDSMRSAGQGYNPGNVNDFGSPFMFYRYKAFPNASNWGGNAFPPNPIYSPLLNKWDDSQLDLVYGKGLAGAAPPGVDPDSATANNEAFPFAQVTAANPLYGTWGRGVLASGDCSQPHGNHWTNSGIGDKNLFYTFLPNARSSAAHVNNIIRPLCQQKASEAAWSTTLNQKLSRLEATRTAALSLLLSLESKPSVASTIEMGFIPWAAGPMGSHRVSMEGAKTISGVSGIHFEGMRNKLLWINRADPDSKGSALPLTTEYGTSIYLGLNSARSMLMAKSYDRRIIVLMTDGFPVPNSGNNSNRAFGQGGLRDYARDTLGNNAPKNQQITLFSVGLIAADANLLNDMSNSTPDGQAYIANDVASLSPIFESIAYQIQKLALLSTADRYGIQF